MAGLSGIVTSGRRLHRTDDLLRKISEVQLVSGITYIEKTYRCEHAAISNVLTGLRQVTCDQPATTPRGDVVLFLEGEIFNWNELSKVTGDTSTTTQDAALLTMYQKFGHEFVTRLNGEFNIVIYEKSRIKISIYSDHVSSMPMYYLETAESLFFGSEKKMILALLESPPSVDFVGLLQIFAHRHNLDERTFICGVRRMMPGNYLTYERGRVRLQQWTRLKFRVPSRLPPASAIVERWGEELKTATARRLAGKERVVVSLSAGLDSRAIACAIPRSFRPVFSRTRGPSDALEPILASQIAARLGFTHFHEDSDSVCYSRMIPKIAWRTECEVHFTNGGSLSTHARVKEHANYIAGGWLGDITSGGHISAAMLRPCGRAEFIERSYLRYLGYSAGSLTDIFTQGFLAENFPKLRQAFVDSFENIEADTNIQLFEIWDLSQRQRRMTTGSMPVDSYAFEKIRPFYDKDYLDFTFTLPLRHRFGQTLYQAMIYRLGPEIRDIPSANTGLRLHESPLRNVVNNGLTISRRIVSKIGEKMHLRQIDHGLGDDLAMATRQDVGFRKLVEDFMSSSDFDAAIFNRSGIKRALDQHYLGAADRSYELGYVATFAAGLPYFLKKTLRCPSEAEPLR